jgi:ribosomal protein S18 acetylase RimI-like enzyme
VHTWTSESNSQFSIVSRPDAPASLDAPLAEKLPAETVLTVCENGVARGYLFISVNTTVPIDVLECKLSFNGAYIRRVYVDQAHRNRGVATALITAANRYASARDATQAVALVAIDNRPSQALFETCGFTVRSTRVYARIGPLSIRHQLPNTQ